MKRNLAKIVVFLAFAQLTIGRPRTASYEDDESYYVDAAKARKLKEKRVNYTFPDDGYFADPAKAFIMQVRRFRVEGRIVGGKEAEPGEASYQLALYKNGRQGCGATLVKIGNLQLGVTAAHCVCQRHTNVPVSPQKFYVRGGSNNKYSGQLQEIQRLVVHEGYQARGSFFHDIALLFFKGQFKLSPKLLPVSLPDEYTDEDPESLIVSGWGRTSEAGQSVRLLQIVTVPVIDRDDCLLMYNHHFQNRPDYLDASICAGFPEGGKDGCQGDSGGPAVAVDDRGLYFAGVVSWGEGCARPGSPGVYTRVSRHVDFIHNQVDIESSMRRPIG